MITAIFAVDSKGGLGKNGSLPWPRNSEDLSWFKQNTTGNIVVMGGNTWRDPLMPKPLPGRTNVVITSQGVDVEGVIVYNDNYKERLKELWSQNPGKEIFIIGGASILLDTKDLVDRVLLTKFNEDYECDISIDLENYLSDFTLILQVIKDSGTYQSWKKSI